MDKLIEDCIKIKNKNNGHYCQNCGKNYGTCKGKQRVHWGYGICNICVNFFFEDKKDISDKKVILYFYSKRTNCKCLDYNVECRCYDSILCEGDFLVIGWEELWYRGCNCNTQDYEIKIDLT